MKKNNLILGLIILLIFPLCLKAELVISEIMYNPPSKINNIKINDFDYEWIELYNNTDKSLPINNYKISAGNSLHPDSAIQFEIKSNIMLPAYEYLIVSRNPNVFNENDNIFKFHYPSVKYLVGLNDYERMQRYLILSNRGCEIRLYDPSNKLVDKVEYSKRNGWDKNASGKGSTLERINFNTDGNNPLNWKCLIKSGYYGSPGKALESNDDEVNIESVNSLIVNTDNELVLDVTNKTASEISKIEIDSSENLSNSQKRSGSSKADIIDNLSIKPYIKKRVKVSKFRVKNNKVIKVKTYFKNNKSFSKEVKLKVNQPYDGSGLVNLSNSELDCNTYYKNGLTFDIYNNGKSALDKLKIMIPEEWQWSGLKKSIIIDKDLDFKIVKKRRNPISIVFTKCKLKPNHNLKITLKNFKTYWAKSDVSNENNTFKISTAEKNGELKLIEKLPFVKLKAVLVKANHLVINEVMYYSDAKQGIRRHYKFIKLYNPTNKDIVINNWKLRDGLPETNKEGVWLLPDGKKLVVKSGQEFVIAADADYYIKTYNKTPDIEANTENYVKQGKSKIYKPEMDNPVRNLKVVGTFKLSARGDDVILLDDKDNIIDIVSWGKKASVKLKGYKFIKCQKNHSIKRIKSGYESKEIDNDPFSEIICNSFK